MGKTTTAVNLAASLALAGRRTLLIDFDPQGNASSGVGRPHDPNIELTTGPASQPGLLSQALAGKGLSGIIQPTSFDRLSLVPSSSELSQIALVHEVHATGMDELRGQILLAARQFDFILLDCPPSLGGLPTIALGVSDCVLIPVQCEYYAMEGLSQILPVISKIQQEVNTEFFVAGLLLTMFSEDLDLSHDVVHEVTGYFKDSVFTTIIPRDVVLAEAASHGLPAFHYAPASRGAWSYVELAKEVLANDGS